MELKFPPLNGGTQSGLNDAGIETFEGDFARNIIRECVQNSLDAAADPERPVSLNVGCVFLERQELPFLPALKAVLESCESYWHQNQKAREFFRKALAILRGPQITAIRISDSGTTGVDGRDADISSRWFGLVKSRGVSNQKEADSGGAFGIGKDAPLAGSAFRTVLYSTRTLDGKVAFQGVCRLVSHKDENGEITQGTGFIGNFDAANRVYHAIRDPNHIPRRFLRTEPGLDIWIIGSKGWDSDWAKPFVHSALANFWPAIAAGKISFRIGADYQIEAASLGRIMRAERFDSEVAAAWPFYLSIVDQHAKEFRRNLPTAGQCRLNLLLGHRELPKQICMVRRTGMVIESYAPRVGFLPFSGLFVCEGAEGNRLLRTLEPPRHNKWDIKRAEDPTAALALKEIREWIRDVLRQQTPHSTEDQFNESEVPPDLLEDIPENPIIDDTQEYEPDLGGNPKEAAPPQKVKVRTRTMRKTAEEGKSGTEEGDDVDNPKKGDGKSTGGRKNRTGEGKGDSKIAPKTPALKTRAFCRSDSSGLFEIVLRCDEDYQGNVWLEAVGDDGAAENIVVESAELVGVGPAEAEQSKIKNLTFKPDESIRLKVKLKAPGKFSLRATLA